MRGSERIKEAKQISKTNMSCARVQQYTLKGITAAERHNERKNTDYTNLNVDLERSSWNVHFKDTKGKTYLEVLKEKEDSGELSRRGLREDATIFDEIVFDINTKYFEERGGYEYAVQFYKEAYRYACIKFGEGNIVSAVMHADEINKAISEEFGYPVYHYHLHVVAFPVVEKKILWSKRCKNPELVGQVKEVISQISHSKMWESREPLLDEHGDPVMNNSGSIRYKKSYSILQDEFFQHMTDNGFIGFVRGLEGHNVSHLSSLEYQIQQDTRRLSEIEHDIEESRVRYERTKDVNTTKEALARIGKLNQITKNYTITKSDYETLTALAVEGITSRDKIDSLERNLKEEHRRYFILEDQMEALEEHYNNLLKKCEPFLEALKRFPEKVENFMKEVQADIVNIISNEKDRNHSLKETDHDMRI